jgi:hypothetical protein
VSRTTEAPKTALHKLLDVVERVGKKVPHPAGARFRDRYGLTVIGLRRGVVAHGRGLQNEELKVGDTLLLIGPWKAIENLQSDGRDLVILNYRPRSRKCFRSPARHCTRWPAWSSSSG